MEIKDFLHFYIGCDVMLTEPEGVPYKVKLTGIVTERTDYEAQCRVQLFEDDGPDGYEGKGITWHDEDEIELILRPLSDMTEEEERYMVSTQDDVKLDGYPEILLKADSGETFRYMLSKGFDLFGLIDAGLAIDRLTTL